MRAFTLRYSDAMIRQAVRARWWKLTGLSYPLVLGLLAVYVGYRISVGELTWYVGAIGTTVVLGITVIITLYAVLLRRSMTRFRNLGQPQAILEVSEERFRVVAERATSELAWSLIQRIQCYETFWLIYVSRDESMILPVEDLPEETQEFIKKKVLENGGKVV